MRRVGVIVACGLLTACSGPAATPTPKALGVETPVAAEPEPVTVKPKVDEKVEEPIAKALSCDERVEQLKDGFKRERSVLRVPMGVQPVKVSAWKETAELGPVISISATNEMHFEGERLPRSEVMRRLENLGDDRASVPLFIMADRRAAARVVYATIKGHPEKLVPRLVVARDKLTDPSESIEAPAGGAPWVATWLTTYKAQSDRSERARQLRSGLTKAAGIECKELASAFEAIANAFGQTREVAAIEIPKALAACQCLGVDPGFEMIFTLSRSRADGLGELPLGEESPSSVGAKATVAELARALSASLPAE